MKGMCFSCWNASFSPLKSSSRGFGSSMTQSMNRNRWHRAGSSRRGDHDGVDWQTAQQDQPEPLDRFADLDVAADLPPHV
jgi:hypothetical protein